MNPSKRYVLAAYREEGVKGVFIMALIRAAKMGGGGKLPFTLSVYSNRCTIDSQDCYVWLDGDTVKIHYQFAVTIKTSVSANAVFVTGAIPFNAQSNVTEASKLPNNLFVSVSTTNNGMLGIASSSALSNGNTLNVNTDITTTWNS